MNKFVLESPQNSSPMQIRMYFAKQNVHQKVCNLYKQNLVHLNVEVVKYLKAHIQVQTQLKDKVTVQYLIMKSFFDIVPQMYLQTQNKNSLLGSCILSFFDQIAEQLENEQLEKLFQKYTKQGFHKTVFLNEAYKSDFKRFSQVYMSWASRESLECLELLESEGKREPSKDAVSEEMREVKSDSENERYNDMVYQSTVKKIDTASGKQVDMNSLIDHLQQLKARSNRSESQPSN